MARAGNQRLQHALHLAAVEPSTEYLPDRELLERFLAARDTSAFGELLRRHGPMVLGVCRAILRDAADVEDAFQATFIVLARRAASIRRSASLASWLHGVACRAAQKARAQHARRLKHEPNAARSEIVPPDDLSWREVQQVLHEELNALSEGYRVPLVLCYLQGKTLDETAARLGLAKNTIKTRLERGRAILRARLARRGLGSAAVMLAASWPSATASACLSAALVSRTIQAASPFPEGPGAAAGVSAEVIALTEGVLKSMSFNKLKIGVVMLLAFAATIGARGLSSPPPQAEQPEAKPFRAVGMVWPPVPATRATFAEEPKPITVSGRLSYLAWSPDGRILVTSSGKDPKKGTRLGNSTVQFWDAKTGKEKLSLGEVAETRLERPTFSSDGKQLALLSYKKEDNRNVFDVQIYDTAKGTLVREIKECHYLGGWPAFSPDGKTLATIGQNLEPFRGEFERFVAEVKLWDVATGEMKRLLEDKRELDFRSQIVGGLAFSPDGKTLATPGIRLEYTKGMVPDMPDLKNPIIHMPRSHYEVVLWELELGKVKRVLKGESSWFSVAFSPDGKFLVAADYLGEAQVWDVATGKLERTLVHEREAGCQAILSADGKWLATKSGKFNKEKRQNEISIKLWDFRTGEMKQTLPGSELIDAGPVVFSPDGKRLALGIGSKVRFWDVEKAAFEK